MAQSHEFEVTIPSDTAAGREIQDRIVNLLEQFEYAPRDVFGMRLALEEAIVNAIKHGNGMSPDKSVRIHCCIDVRSVEVVIEDEGEGFDLEDVPDPTEDENLDRPCGRGIMLMQSFLDVVDYHNRGTRVRLVKNRNAGD